MTPSPTQQDEIVERRLQLVERSRKWAGTRRQHRSEDEGDAIMLALADAVEALVAHLPTPPGRWVPLEPTEAMIDACLSAVGEWRKTLTRDEDRVFLASATPREKAAIRYRAMLEAAPAGGSG